MSDRSPKILDTPPESTQHTEVDASRRKLSGAALGVSAFFTLASRPVLAVQCMSPSSAASGNLSTHGTPPSCTGKTAAQWAAIDKQDLQENPKFKDVFANGTYATWGSDDKLADVLDAADNSNASPSPNPISKEFAATYLNILDGRIPESVLSQTALIVMWGEWVNTGGFAPNGGATWNAEQIVIYLRSLQGA